MFSLPKIDALVSSSPRSLARARMMRVDGEVDESPTLGLRMFVVLRLSFLRIHLGSLSACLSTSFAMPDSTNGEKTHGHDGGDAVRGISPF